MSKQQEFQAGDKVRYAHGDTVKIVTVIGGHMSEDPLRTDYTQYTVALELRGRPLWTIRVNAGLLSPIKE